MKVIKSESNYHLFTYIKKKISQMLRSLLIKTVSKYI
jgi:hypothetical protein